MKPKDLKFYIDALRSDECQCGRSKKRGQALCYFHCYKKLPKDMQRSLYYHMGDGYEEAYDAAVNYLKDE